MKIKKKSKTFRISLYNIIKNKCIFGSKIKKCNLFSNIRRFIPPDIFLIFIQCTAGIFRSCSSDLPHNHPGRCLSHCRIDTDNSFFRPAPRGTWHVYRAVCCPGYSNILQSHQSGYECRHSRSDHHWYYNRSQKAAIGLRYVPCSW